MPGYYAVEFPYELQNGYASVQEALDAGWDRDQIWSIAYCGTVTTYGPAHHTVGIEYYGVTIERHDGDTYFEDDMDADENEGED